MTRNKLIKAALDFNAVLIAASKEGILDQLAGDVHPDKINAMTNVVEEIASVKAKPEEDIPEVSYLKKVTTGFVTQVFDRRKSEFVSQNFTAGDTVDFEDFVGNAVDSEEFFTNRGVEAYLPFNMEQPL